MIPKILICCWEMCMKAPFVKISLKGESVRVTQWMYVERCQNFHVVIKNIKDKVLRSSPTECLKENQRYSNHLKNVTICFLLANRKKYFIGNSFFFFFSPCSFVSP